MPDTATPDPNPYSRPGGLPRPMAPDPRLHDSVREQSAAERGFTGLPTVEDDAKLLAELGDDPGWWRVAWPPLPGRHTPRAVTYFRSRDLAVELDARLRPGVAQVFAVWVQELP